MISSSLDADSNLQKFKVRNPTNPTGWEDKPFRDAGPQGGENRPAADLSCVLTAESSLALKSVIGMLTDYRNLLSHV